jgi:uncharacterized protein YueI
MSVERRDERALIYIKSDQLRSIKSKVSKKEETKKLLNSDEIRLIKIAAASRCHFNYIQMAKTKKAS